MKLVLLRHGESVWNKENKFTGWTDVALTELGKEEAIMAGRLLKEKDITFDVVFTSVLQRAIDTMNLVLKELEQSNIPIFYSYKLNERHYGALQGLNKDDVKRKYGDQQVFKWRRSINERPPSLTKDDERYSINDPKYKGLAIEELPFTESLNDTFNRVISYYQEVIVKELIKEKDVLIVAHNNSLRALLKFLENISDDDIEKIEFKTGKPYIYEMDSNLQIKTCHYL